MFTGTEICSDNSLQLTCNVPSVQCGACGKQLCYGLHASTTLSVSEGLSSLNHVFLIASASIVIAIAGIRSFFELIQLLVSRHHYLFDWVNWIEVLTFVSSIAFTLVYFTDCLCPTGWQWQLGCIAVFFTWIDLIIFIQKLPLTGTKLIMLRICYRALNFLCMYEVNGVQVVWHLACRI